MLPTTVRTRCPNSVRRRMNRVRPLRSPTRMIRRARALAECTNRVLKIHLKTILSPALLMHVFNALIGKFKSAFKLRPTLEFTK